MARGQQRPSEGGDMAHDEDWDVVIARAKMQAALPKAASPPPPPSWRNEWDAMTHTPPPVPRGVALDETRTTRDTLMSGRTKKPTLPRLLVAFTARRSAGADQATPPPVVNAR